MGLSSFIKKLIETDTLWGVSKKKIAGINDRLNYLFDSDVVFDNATNSITYTNQTSLPSWIVPGKYFRVYDGIPKTYTSDSDNDYIANVILTPDLVTNSGVKLRVLSVSGNVIYLDSNTSTVVDRNTSATFVTTDGRIAIGINNIDIAKISKNGSTIYNTQNSSSTGDEDGSAVGAMFADHYHSNSNSVDNIVTHEYNSLDHKLKVYDEETDTHIDMGPLVVVDNNGNVVVSGGN